MMMRITGTGSALPRETVDNNQIAEWVETSDEWIRERTGIGSRRISTGETVVSLAAQACEKALQQAGKDPLEVDMILLATCSPEYLLPCCACQVQAQIGAANAVAFDINAACAGFLFGLNTAYAYLQTGMYKTILVVGSEVLSKLVDWKDRSSCILFGDGAGAALVEAAGEQEQPCGLIAGVQGCDGVKGMALKCRERALQNPLFREEFQDGENLYVQMDGREVYRFATRQVADCIQEALEKAKLSVEDIDLFVLHQANVRIIEAVAKRLHADMQRFPMNLEQVGNISSATIPVLLDELNRQGKLHRGDKIVLSGFGAGLTYGACIFVW